MNIKDYEKQLKPCPFCGSTPTIGEYGYGSGNYGSGHRIEIHCNHCKVEMICGDTSWRSLENCQEELQEAVNKWNNRK